ncbi:type VII toxin-antitoxin system HepT family RNase toxin [Dictyoglomus thermophilum]|jgi:uncharacterized protein YutE (UPF0331/DUF86 family)|uniref:DUF86 domain-containing protein n=1 Tax=Dictyoglomus thermophilum (strain ATCC 35947 / DSM 3960 / H-6-12) TaxID=309799 RepID=B5YBA5_DICT6|nr:DUF86 domain-containing protein [Dictyoglomus thermophilum]ACI19445.1 protein of unknown function [Dictyoglomus thermophilum H-6-12]
MNIDLEKIKQRVSDIIESIEEINKLTSMDEGEFWVDKRNIASLKYFLLQAIEALGSICVHICAKKLNRGVSSIGECIELLQKENIISLDLFVRLKKMIGFRNRLIHRYWEIDDKKVYEYAQKDLKDLYDFINEIKKLF